MIFKFSIKKLFYLRGKYFSKEIILKYKKQSKTYFGVKIKFSFLEKCKYFSNSKYPTVIEIFHENHLCYACFKLFPFYNTYLLTFGLVIFVLKCSNNLKQF